jgi:endonuclease-3
VPSGHISSERRSKRETQEQKALRAAKILRLLEKVFPRPATALHHANAFQLLIATILSAQCTDERVNKVTPSLFAKYPNAKAFAVANQAELENDIRSTGFFRMKAKSIIACAKALDRNHGGDVPQNMDDLLQLPGVGRKTANVVLGQAFRRASGVVVDTHVHRLAKRLGFSEAEDAGKVEQDLMDIFPKKKWIDVGTVLILHGRKTCTARKPKCTECVVNELCPSAGKV